MFLSIKDLSVSIEEKKILDNFSLEIKQGEVHAIMGPNGCGKSTLSNVLAGKEDYEILKGEIIFKDQNLLDLNIEERSQLGIFLAFQYPIEIPGVNITPFLKTSLNAKLKKEGKPEVDALTFAKELKKVAENLGISLEMLSRSVNQGFSGGEKKRYEILQMSILKPSLAILDETDSGLDVDAFKTVTKGVNGIKNNENSFLIITHYQKLLEHIVPDFIHIMKNGTIIKTGDKSIAKQIEENGYKNF
jgi:Fe-S cluster assembly ATP-binding protein